MPSFNSGDLAGTIRALLAGLSQPIVAGVDDRDAVKNKLIAAGVASFADTDLGSSVRTKINAWLNAAAATFTMTQLAAADRIYQRSTLTGGGQNKGQGTIPVALSAATAAGKIYARCSSGGGTRGDLQAPWRAALISSTGAQTVNIAGVDARLGFFYLDLSGDGTTWQNGTVLVGMGALVAMSGQSLMTRLFHKYTSEDTTTITGAGASVPANGRIFAAIDTDHNSVGTGASQIPTAWVQPSDTTTNHDWSAALNGAGAAELLTRLVAVAGVNVGLVAKAEGQTAIADWQAGQALGDALTATMDAAGGKFEAVIWYQGHTDSGNGKSVAYYQAQLDALFTNLAAHNTFASPAKVLASIPNINSTSWGTVDAKEAIRRASYDWAIANGGIPVQMNDIAMGSDGVHALQVGSARQGGHFYRALRPHFAAAHDDKTTTFGTPTHASGSVNIVIPFSGNNLSSVGSPATRFKVYKRGLRSGALAFDGTTPFAIDNTAKTVTLKLAADPGQIPLDVLPFGANDPANDGSASMVYDNVTDGDGLSTGRQVHPGSGALHVAVNQDLTISSGSYGAGKFSNTLTAGYGVAPAAMLPALAEGFRFEAWVRIDTPDSGVKVFIGQRTAGWIGCQNNDLKLAIGGDTASVQTFANALPTGVWKHVAVTCDAPGLLYTVHINGVQQGTTYATTTDYDGSAYPLAVRAFGGLVGSFDLTTQSVDEVAIWRSKWPASVMPSAAYAGTEAGLLAYWPLQGSGANAAA